MTDSILARLGVTEGELEESAQRRRAKEAAIAAEGRRADEELREQVRAAKREAAAEAEEEAKLSPEERIERRRRLRERQRELPLDAARNTFKPDGWALAVEAVEAEEAAERLEERRQRERDAGLPRLQARYDARLREIDEACTAAIAQNHERCHEADRAAVDAKQRQRAELGERPSLESLEAKV
jgi:hypothetical protein